MLIAGKGHEDYQIYGGERRAFSDQKVGRGRRSATRAGGARMNRTLEEFARSCGGTLIGADRAYTGVSTDTRTLKAGELFVALRGPRFNANDFVAAAETAGAAGAVVDTRVDRAAAADRRAGHAGGADRVAPPRGARSFRCRSSASPAATARPRSRR